MTAVNWATPNAELVLPVDPDPIEWLKVRRQGLGGTDAATIMSANKFEFLYRMWQDKTSTETPVDEDNDLFWYGHEIERPVRNRFASKTGFAVRRVGTLRSKTHPFMQANIDALTSDGGILEIKSTEWFTESGKEWTGGDIPDHPWWQVQHCLAVSGRSHGWFAALVGRRLFIVGPIERDEEAIERLIAAEQTFWEDHVVPQIGPAVDLTTITEEEAKARFPVVTPDKAVDIDDQPIPEIWVDTFTAFIEARDKEAAAKREKEAAKAKLMAVIGDREFLTRGGRPLLRWGQVSGASYFDKDGAVNKLADLTGKTPFEVERELTKKRADTRSLTVVKQPKQKMEKAA